jgi:phage tail-like protein
VADISTNNYFFLNREGRWPHFQMHGLDVLPEGSLRLSTVPLLNMPLPDSVRTAPTPAGPAGIVVDCSGNIYYTDPDSSVLMRVSGCDASVAPVPCVRQGSSGLPGQWNAQRGLLIPPSRRVLFVADSGNHRLQIFDLDTFQLLEIWGAGTGFVPSPSSLPGRFNMPWTLAADSAGNVYVVDYGNSRVQKLNPLGQVMAPFSVNCSASGVVEPSDIAVSTVSGNICVFVLDASTHKIHLLDVDGNPLKDSAGNPLVLSDANLQQPMGLAAAGDSLYVGDNAARRIFRFQVGNTSAFVGEAIGYEGPVAGLFANSQGTLWVNPGNSQPVITSATQQGFGTQGVLWRDTPIVVPGRKAKWHRFQAILQKLNAAAHLDVFAYATDQWNDAPAVDPAAPHPFADKRWKSMASLVNLDLTDLYIGSERKKFLWVGALFSGDGTATPILEQLRVEFDWPTLDQYLPAIYRNTGKCEDFLVRLLSLFQSLFEDIETEIDRLPALFDPFAAPADFLSWLGGCLGLDMDENWSEEKEREIIGEIFDYYGKRGTREGLREALRLFAGVNAIIDEPILNAAWWALPEGPESCCSSCAEEAVEPGSWTNTGNSILGWTTMLSAAQPQGAVVGTSADLDQSHLIPEEEFGVPLFSDVAYRFRVTLYRSQVMSPEVLTRIRAVLDAEKPAHTVYEICFVDPLFRVGFQSCVGVDTVVGGPPRSLALGSGQALGVNTALAGVTPPRLGSNSRLGVSTRLA